jgi:hypothetical protein
MTFLFTATPSGGDFLPAAPGLYRVSSYLVCTTADPASTRLAHYVRFTDISGTNQFVSTGSSNGCPTVGVVAQGTAVIHLPAGQGVSDIIFSDVGSEYTLFVTLEHLADCDTNGCS